MGPKMTTGKLLSFDTSTQFPTVKGVTICAPKLCKASHKIKSPELIVIADKGLTFPFSARNSQIPEKNENKGQEINTSGGPFSCRIWEGKEKRVVLMKGAWHGQSFVDDKD